MLPPFQIEWRDEDGQLLNVGDDFFWDMSMGNLVMNALWNDTITCAVQHNITLNPMTGDFDFDGQVGVQDILVVLSELSCIGTCTTDLNGDGSVGTNDLLALLTLVGQSCL